MLPQVPSISLVFPKYFSQLVIFISLSSGVMLPQVRVGKVETLSCSHLVRDHFDLSYSLVVLLMLDGHHGDICKIMTFSAIIGQGWFS